jgi:hypothetical protein
MTRPYCPACGTEAAPDPDHGVCGPCADADIRSVRCHEARHEARLLLLLELAALEAGGAE